MVKVRQEQPLLVDGSVNIEMWLCKIGDARPEINLSRLREVCDLSEQAEEKALATGGLWTEGHSSFRMGLGMAEILNELYVDENGMVAAIIYRAVRENQLTLNHVKKQFGADVARLVEGTLKMAAISDIQFGTTKKLFGERQDQMGQARRMLVSLVDDVRVALLKLAERTCAIRNAVASKNPGGLKLAREVFEIYAPLAHRLGIGHLKWELEDLSFRLREPVSYKRIAKLLDEKRTVRQEYIANVVSELNLRVKQVGIDCKVDGRPKHIYSIWRKMRRKGIPFSEVYDVRAVRILVGDEGDCYRILGVVHNQWRNVPHEFDDYVANPKENGYQSLHTAVIGPEGKVLEIQIRTAEMHEEAEFGICSHWQYKDAGDLKGSESYEQRIAWIRQIIEGQDEEDDSDLDLFSALSVDRIYVFTPDGDVVDMTPGATPIDFAYRVHTEIGHKCRSAKLNGRVVPLNTAMSSGDRVEIIVGDEPEPRREWLHEHLGYVATSRARTKIQGWFARREKEKNVEEGKKLLIEELSHLGVEHFEFSDLVERMDYESPSELFYAIAIGELTAFDVVEEAADLVQLNISDHQLDLDIEAPENIAAIEGQGDLDFEMSECCQPVPGDLIVGVVDDADLVHVHRHDCLQALKADVYGRLMSLEWKESVEVTFPVSIEVLAYDRYGLLHDITGILMREHANVRSTTTLTDRHNNRVSIKMVIEVVQLNKLLQTLEKMKQLPNVTSARRTVSS
ncbi:MAG: bifunctional (p)ppGpp synthetase/guanosine-3',5'-bis(diphosphate) 3'-pyrophosphohydrolase [Gammaproteobacteria bacterium]|nr:bifunctional (p)ppGpp synthetase/guanosine-3',5'-bis(diphosphate) 3'-pyrophosphohydrolase [Gammaproteobacteria bacterium]